MPSAASESALCSLPLDAAEALFVLEAAEALEAYGNHFCELTTVHVVLEGSARGAGRVSAPVGDPAIGALVWSQGS